MLGPLWLRVKPYLAGRNESAPAQPAPGADLMRGADDLVDLQRQLEDFVTAVRSADASPTVLRKHFRQFGTTLAHAHARLNETEAQLRAGLDVVHTIREIFGDSKERLALTLANMGHVEIVRTLFVDPEGLEADLYVDHIERRAAEAEGPVPATDLNGIFAQRAGRASGDAGDQAKDNRDPRDGPEPN